MDRHTSSADASYMGIGQYMAPPMAHYDDDGGEERPDNVKENLREQDIFLPIANIARIMNNAIPETIKTSKDSKVCVQECVSEFISFVTSEAAERCLQERRKTTSGDDILWALSSLGFDAYVEPLKLYLQKYREAMAAEKEAVRTENNGMHGGGGGVASRGERLVEEGLVTADGQQQNLMVYSSPYHQHIPAVQQVQFSRHEDVSPVVVSGAKAVAAHDDDD